MTLYEGSRVTRDDYTKSEEHTIVRSYHPPYAVQWESNKKTRRSGRCATHHAQYNGRTQKKRKRPEDPGEVGPVESNLHGP